ncbi:MAG: S26 family signal peptidase [Candidatus Poseidonia sp.]|nr:S26 family signal peptidase [Poseidonia sp.]
MSDSDPFKTLVLEICLAVGMIASLIGALYIHTGSMPPLVVVESSSMIHEKEGEVGSIDAGDLVLVHDHPADTVVTFAEATDSSHPSFGYQQHGMEGDVIIYEKNGEIGTPIIHRAIMRVVAHDTALPDRNATAGNECLGGGTFDDMLPGADGEMGVCVLTWSVPGTNVTDVANVTVAFDGIQTGYYDCKRPAHNNVESYLVVWEWEPRHQGMLTLGDNNKCSVDQGAGATNGSAGVHSASGVVGPIRNNWVIGVAGGEIPWLGTVKLMTGGPGSPGTTFVPSSSFLALFTLIAVVLISPFISEAVFKRWLAGGPEFQTSKKTLADVEEE